MSEETDWAQLSLLPLPVVEMQLRIGFVSETNHVQWQLRTTDPAAGTLLGMVSCPHDQMHAREAWLSHICQEITTAFLEHVHPF